MVVAVTNANTVFIIYRGINEQPNHETLNRVEGFMFLTSFLLLILNTFALRSVVE
jgi:hypothetical protein